MTPFNALIAAKLRMARHHVASVRSQSRLKVAVLTTAVVLIWAGAFAFFYLGFAWLLRFGGSGQGAFVFGELLLRQSLGIFTLIVFLLLIFSNILVAYATMYRAHEVVYLLHAPLDLRTFFYARFAECVVFSSWALAYLGSPMLLAYGISTGASPAYYAALLVFFPPFIVIPAALGAIIAILLVRVFPRAKAWVLFVVVTLGLGIFFLVAGNVLHQGTDDEQVIMSILEASARTQSPLLPSYWAAQGLMACGSHDFRQAGYLFLLLLSNAAFFLWVGGELAARQFYAGWSYLMGQDRQRIHEEGKGVLGQLERFLPWLPNPARVLTIKDIRLFWRDPTQWSQFVIFFGIMAVYIANLRLTGHQLNSPLWRSWIACMNMGAVCLILATLTSRFVFPLVSLEGRRFWVLRLAPLSLRQLVWQKFALSVATTSFFTVGLALLSGTMLRLDPLYFWLTVYSVALTNFALAGLAVGLGALYPTFTEDNPARIVSGMGGTLNLLLSVGYITIVVLIITLIMQWRVMELFDRPGLFWYALGGGLVTITALSAACVVLPMRTGLRNLEHTEF